VYGPTATAFVEASKRLGIPAVDGGEMLLHQGAVSFERWWGETAPIEAMRRALGAARSAHAGV
jgi:shikimate dehydrogenase